MYGVKSNCGSKKRCSSVEKLKIAAIGISFLIGSISNSDQPNISMIYYAYNSTNQPCII